jgi:hypothetical protein
MPIPLEWLYCAALLITAVVAAVGALHPRYEDTLLQHIGMALTCTGAMAEIYLTYRGMERMHGATLFAVGVALFALGTFLKKLPTNEFLRRYTKT